MVFQKRRTGLVAVALVSLCIIILCNSRQSTADTHIGTRFNGAAANGYFICQSARDQGYTMIFVDAINAWRGKSAKVDMGLHRRVTWLPTNDRCYADASYDLGTFGETRYYERRNNVVKRLPDDEISTKKANWYFATEVVYPTNIQREVGNDDDLEQDFALNVAIHEIGHSLKMAHPSYEDSMVGRIHGEGTERKDTPMFGGSIMEKYPSASSIKIAPLAVGVSELRAKWGK